MTAAFAVEVAIVILGIWIIAAALAVDIVIVILGIWIITAALAAVLARRP